MQNLLINILIHTYFPHSQCLCLVVTNSTVIEYDNGPPTLTHPLVIISSVTAFDTSKFKCQDFVLLVSNSTHTLNAIEEYLQKKSNGGFNNRKYLVFLQDNDILPKTCIALKHTYDILFILTSNNKQILKIFRHNFVKSRGNSTFELVNVWYSNNTLKYPNITGFKYELPIQEKRDFAIGILSNLPYIDAETMGGTELNIIKAYIKKYNFTLKLYTVGNVTGWGKLGEYWNATENSIREFHLKDKIDAMFGCHILSSLNLRYFDLTIPSTQFLGKVLVPRPKKHFDMLFALNIQDALFWAFLILGYLFLGLLICLRKYLFKVKFTFDMFRLYRLLVNQLLDGRYIPRDYFTRVVYAMILIYGILFSTAYNSSVASRLAAPNFIGEINTIDDFIESKIVWLGDTEIFLTPLSQGRKLQLRNKFRMFSPELLHSLQQENQPFSAIFIQLQSGYIAIDEIVLNWEDFQLMNEEFMRENTYFILRKNSVFKQSINQMIRLCLETGLIHKWEQDTILRAQSIITQYKLLDSKVFNIVKPASMQQMKSLFTFWAVGIAMSIIVFVSEIVFKRDSPAY